MNRLEYLTQLRRSLEDGGLAEDEINDAMGFYEEIFLDAGAAHEAETAANLGSPEELANKFAGQWHTPTGRLGISNGSRR